VAKRRHGLNPAKLKADLAALEREAPAQALPPWLDIRRRASTALLCLLSSVLLLVCFVPFDLWYLAYVALVPWGLAVVAGQRSRWTLLWAYLSGVVFWVIGLYWLTWITLVGYLPLVLYLGSYWLVAAVVVRAAFRRGWPVWVILPLVWVALEYARAFALSGFPWFFLAHSQAGCTRLIQIADLTGQYGVSFFVAMVNGALIEALAQLLLVKPARKGRPIRRIALAAGACLAGAAFLLTYGIARLSQQPTRPGPKLGVVQLAFPIALYQTGASPEEIFAKHLDNTRPLVGAGCDLVVWPESMLGYHDMDPAVWFARDADAKDSQGQPVWTARQREIIREYHSNLLALQRLLADQGCPLLAGGGMPDSVSRLTSNCALLFDRDSSGRIRLKDQYAKMHLVPFGEYVPFRQGWPGLHSLLRRFVPEAMPQILPGRRRVVFEVRPGGGDQPPAFRFAVPICYEGVFARVCRRLAMRGGRKQVDLLVNISNDGWFIFATSRWTHASTELEQHLRQYVFRAVENRLPVVRAVNTGVSAHIDSNGRILQAVAHQGHRKMVAGNLIAQTVVDERVSVYSRAGDVFAQAVSVAAGAAAAAMWLLRRSRNQ